MFRKRYMLNIIINGFDGIFTPVVQHLFENIEIQYCASINTDKINFPSNIIGDYYSYYDLQLCNYNNVDWNIIMPLERDLIENMTLCESTVLKMTERLEPGGVDVRYYNTRKKMYLKHLRYWNHLIETKKIDLVIFSTIPHMMYDYVIYSLCKFKNIKIIMLYRMPILPYKNVSLYMLEDLERPIEEVTNNYLKLNNKYNNSTSNHIELSTELSAYLEEHSIKMDYPDGYTHPGKKLDSKYRSSVIIKNMGFWINMLIEKKYYLIYYRFLLKIKEKSVARFYNKYAFVPDLKKKYIYIALHYQPECTTSPMAGVFVDQILMIQLLSYCVPSNVYLYVKEHPRGNLIIDLDFYDELMKMPNVRLVPREYNNYKLIDNSMAVATATGTAGWEALLREKPVLMFGYYFYQYAPGVHRINNIKDCTDAINEILNKNVSPNLDQIKLFLKAIEPLTLKGYVDFRYEEVANISKEDNIENIKNALVKKINYVFNNKEDESIY